MQAMLRVRGLLVFALAGLGCGGSEGDGGSAGEPPDPPPHAEACEPGSLADSAGDCIAAGITEGACASGFEWAEGSCEPILPDAPCDAGELAVPGEASCHPVATCGAGPWGDIPVEPNTEHVDRTYGGADSDGSPDKPWPTVQAAIDAAEDSAIVAIAPGTYAEQLVVLGKRLRIWGKCPQEVALEAPSPTTFALDIRGGSDKTEVRALSVSGPGSGIATSASEELVFEQLWIHDTGDFGLLVTNQLATASATLRGSLVEGTGNFGVLVDGATLLIESSAVRDTVSHEATLGRGVNAFGGFDGTRSQLTLRGSVVESNPTMGIYVGASDALIEGSVVRRQLPDLDGSGGIGLVVEPFGGELSDVTVKSSAFVENLDLGMLLAGTAARIEDTAVVRTQPNASGGFGRGIYIQEDVEGGAPSTVTVSRSSVDDNHETGVFVIGSIVTLESTRVRNTARQVSDDRAGAGVAVLYGTKTDRASDVRLVGCLVEGNSAAGLLDYDSTLTVEKTLVRGTLPLPGDQYGDGIGVVGNGTVTVLDSRIEESARAAIANFGALATVRGSHLACNPIDLDAETFAGDEARFENLGDNTCTCGEAGGECQVSTTQLSAPGPLQTQ